MGSESTLESFKKDITKQQTEKLEEQRDETPAVSQAMVAWLKKMFPAPIILDSEPLMGQQLTVDYGKQQVIKFLEATNERQEAEGRAYLSSTPNRPS